MEMLGYEWQRNANHARGITGFRSPFLPNWLITLAR